MMQPDEFYKWKNEIDKKLNSAILRLDAMQLQLYEYEEELDKKLDDIKGKLHEYRMHIISGK